MAVPGSVLESAQFSQNKNEAAETWLEWEWRFYMRSCLMMLCLLLAVAPLSAGEDPTKVDAKHYKVVVENDDVRVLRITYGAGEKSVMHYHPDSVAVFLVDQKVRFTMPDGSTEEVENKKGATAWIAGGDHLPENIGDGKIEVILVELKGGKKGD